MAKSRALGIRLMYSILHVLAENDGGMRGVDIEHVLQGEKFLDEWARHLTASGGVRWVNIMYFCSVELVKAEYIIKNKGRWFITSEGREAMARQSPEELTFDVHQRYRRWQSNRPEFGELSLEASSVESLGYSDIKEKSSEDIKSYVRQKNAYEYQNMVAALLRAMGYYTPFVAPRGRDGGVDVIALSDPLGARKPILKVQVKHYNDNNPISVDVIRGLVGVAKDDVPIVVTSGHFAEPAKVEARINNVRLIDGEEFVELWIRYFSRMDENDKALMPIEPIYFIKRDEL